MTMLLRDVRPPRPDTLDEIFTAKFNWINLDNFSVYFFEEYIVGDRSYLFRPSEAKDLMTVICSYAGRKCLLTSLWTYGNPQARLGEIHQYILDNENQPEATLPNNIEHSGLHLERKVRSKPTALENATESIRRQKIQSSSSNSNGTESAAAPAAAASNRVTAAASTTAPMSTMSSTAAAATTAATITSNNSNNGSQNGSAAVAVPATTGTTATDSSLSANKDGGVLTSNRSSGSVTATTSILDARKSSD